MIINDKEYNVSPENIIRILTSNFSPRCQEQAVRLAERNANIMLDRHGYYSDPMKLRELSEKYGITKEAARTFVKRAERKLVNQLIREKENS